MPQIDETLRLAALYGCDELLLSADEATAKQLASLKEIFRLASREEIIQMSELIVQIKQELVRKRQSGQS